jgi:hypothetical protein
MPAEGLRLSFSQVSSFANGKTAKNRRTGSIGVLPEGSLSNDLVRRLFGIKIRLKYKIVWPQGHKTTRPQGSKTAMPQGSKTAMPQGSNAAMPHDSKTAISYGCIRD